MQRPPRPATASTSTGAKASSQHKHTHKRRLWAQLTATLHPHCTYTSPTRGSGKACSTHSFALARILTTVSVPVESPLSLDSAALLPTATHSRVKQGLYAC